MSVSSEPQIPQPNPEVVQVKDELLAKISELEAKLTLKLQQQSTESTNNFITYATKLNDLDQKYTTLNSGIAEQKVKLTKIDEFDAFKRKADDQLITHEIHLNNTMKDLANAKFKYDKMFIDNLTVPGYVGECSQYKTMRDYIDYNIGIVQTLVVAKDKMMSDLKEVKTQSENLMKDFLNMINANTKRCNDYTDKKYEKILCMLDEYKNDVNEKFMELRVDNTKVSMDLKVKMNEFMGEWDKILQIKEDVYKKLNDHLYIYKTDFNTTQKEFGKIKKEFNKIKGRFGDMVDFIKDVRFRKNLGTFQEIKKSEINKIAKRMSFSRQKSKSIDLNDPEKEIDLDYDFYTGEDIKDIKEDVSRTNKKHKTNIYLKDEDVILEQKEEEEKRKSVNERISKFTQHRSPLQYNESNSIQSYKQNSDLNGFESLNFAKEEKDFQLRNETTSISPQRTVSPDKTSTSFNAKINIKNVQSQPRYIKTEQNFYPKNIKTSSNISNFSTFANVVELDFEDHSKDRLFVYPGSNITNSNGTLNAEFRPTVQVRRTPKKFKTMKENTARIKTCFGSVVNPSNIKKDYIVCKGKNEMSNLGLVRKKK